MRIDAIIEIPYNTNVKYEFDEELKMMRCDRKLGTCMIYPGNYGYIPNTLAGDGDALDILVVCDYPLYPGTVINSRIIGVLLMEDEKGQDEKIIAVPSEEVDPCYKNIKELSDLSPGIKDKIFNFFQHYKDNDTELGKWCKVKNFEDSYYAIHLLKKYQGNYSS